MTIRRIIVWVASIIFGVATTLGILFFFDTTVKKFLPGNTVLVFFAAGSLAFIWLDYILKTDYLRN
jgi:hypothetical protein